MHKPLTLPATVFSISKTVELFVYTIVSIIPAFAVFALCMSGFRLPSGVAVIPAVGAAFLFMQMINSPYKFKFLGAIGISLIAMILGLTVNYVTSVIGASTPATVAISVGIALCFMYAHYRRYKIGLIGFLGNVIMAYAVGFLSYQLGASTDAAVLICLSTLLFLMPWSKWQNPATKNSDLPLRTLTRKFTEHHSNNDDLGVNPATGSPVAETIHDVQSHLILFRDAPLIGSELSNMFTESQHYTNHIIEQSEHPAFNPANGLMMVNDIVDIEGNIYMTDSSHDSDAFNDFSCMHDCYDDFGSSAMDSQEFSIDSSTSIFE